MAAPMDVSTFLLLSKSTFGYLSNRTFQLLDWLDFWSPGNHDDRTIAILYEGEKKEMCDIPEQQECGEIEIQNE